MIAQASDVGFDTVLEIGYNSSAMGFDGPPDGHPCRVEVPEVAAETTRAEERQHV